MIQQQPADRHLSLGSLRSRVMKGSLSVVALLVIGWFALGSFLRVALQGAIESRSLSLVEGRLAWHSRIRPWDADVELLTARMARWRLDFEGWKSHYDAASRSTADAPSWEYEAKLASITQGLERLEFDHCRQMMGSSSSPLDVAEAFVIGFSKQGASHRSLEILSLWEADFPGSAQVPYLRGVVAQAAREQAIARQEFQKALSREPRHELARMSLIDLHIANDELHDAATHCEILLAQTGGSPRAAVLFARCMRLSGRITEARDLLERISASSRTANWYLERGQVAFESGDYSVAVVCMDQAGLSERSPQNSLMTAASIYAFAKKYDRSQVFLSWYDESLSAERRSRELLLRHRLGVDTE